MLLLSYGDIGDLQLPVFSESLRQLADALEHQARAEALLDAIDATLAEPSSALSASLG